MSRRSLAIAFGALLTAYSLTWMFLVRHESAIVLGLEPMFRPIAQRVEVQQVTPGGPAEAAGLRQGDRLVTIDGQPLGRFEPFLDLRRFGQPGQRVQLGVERDGRVFQTSLRLMARGELPPTPAAAAWENPGAFVRVLQQILAFYPLPFLLVALVVLLQRPDDPHAWLLALMLGGFIAAAPMVEFEYRVPEGLRGPLLAFWILLNIPLSSVTYAFFAVFPAHTPIDRRVPWLKTAGLALAYTAAALLAIGILLGRGTYVIWYIGEAILGWEQIVFGTALLAYSIGFTGLAVVSVGLNAFGPPDVRRKTRVILFGLVVGLVPVISMQLLLVAMGGRVQDLPAWFWAFSTAMLFAIPVSLGYAVVKHRAMEIPVLLRRSARYVIVRRGLVTLAIVVGVAATLAFAQLFDAVPGLTPMDRTRAGLILGSVFGGTLVLVGRRLWLPAMDRIDQAFFRGSYDARRLLVTLAEQSRTATDRTTLAEMIDDSVVEALHPKTLLVFLRGTDEWTFDAAAHEGLEGEEARLPATPLQLADLARRGRPVLIDPALLEDGAAWASFAPLRPEALVPLVGRSRQLEGLLVLGPRLSEEPYSGEDISLLASVGTQAGLALENIRLAENIAERIEAERRVSRELEIAREVQAKLLPQKRPALDTLDYAGACLQARIVGGDYFDFVSLAPGQFGLVLADISGKGISAALLMASLQANLRAQYANAPHDLAHVLSSVNQVFFDSTTANHYATLFFGVYEESRRCLRYANCGHLPPILFRGAGGIERLDATAPVVGLFESPWSCGTGATELAPGDTLVIFTDGVSEATSEEGEEFGEERLIALVEQHRRRPACDLLDEVVHAVREHSAQEQFDDLTLIVAHVR